MLRGDVYLAVFDPVMGSEQAGTRPAVIVSRDAINLRTAIVVVAPLTGLEHKERIYPSQVILKAGAGGLTKDSVVLGEQVRVLSKRRLRRRMGQLSLEEMNTVNEAVRNALALD